MWPSAQNKIIRIAIIASALVCMVVCFLLAGWRGPAVVFVFVSAVAGIIGGFFYLSKFFNDNQWRNVFIFSCWLGVVMAIMSFILLLIDPRVTNFSFTYILTTAAIIGFVFIIGSFFVTLINWGFLRLFRQPKRK
jgi:hypothetical protein